MVKYILFICLWSTITVSAQNNETINSRFAIARDSQLVLPHIVKRGNTIYSLSKTYNQHVDSLIKALDIGNELILSLGDTLLIPINGSSLSASRDSPEDIAIYYRVKPKENLFRIARIYLKLREEQIMVLNQMENTNLRIDQELLLGYLNKYRSPASSMVEVEESLEYLHPDTITKEATKLETKFEWVEKRKVYQETNGVALWFADTDYNSGRFIMHESAPVNSIIAITNPMFNKTVYAKVVGNIPPNTYPKEVIAVISPMVAKELGALDKRFYAKIKYEVAGLE